MTKEILQLLQKPRTLGEIARMLAVEEQTVALLLRRLEARGYVGQAYDRSPVCNTNCAGCSLRRLCPAASGTDTPTTFRLTQKGEKTLSSGT